MPLFRKDLSDFSRFKGDLEGDRLGGWLMARFRIFYEYLLRVERQLWYFLRPS